MKLVYKKFLNSKKTSVHTLNSTISTNLKVQTSKLIEYDFICLLDIKSFYKSCHCFLYEIQSSRPTTKVEKEDNFVAR